MKNIHVYKPKKKQRKYKEWNHLWWRLPVLARNLNQIQKLFFFKGLKSGYCLFRTDFCRFSFPTRPLRYYVPSSQWFPVMVKHSQHSTLHIPVGLSAAWGSRTNASGYVPNLLLIRQGCYWSLLNNGPGNLKMDRKFDKFINSFFWTQKLLTQTICEGNPSNNLHPRTGKSNSFIQKRKDKDRSDHKKGLTQGSTQNQEFIHCPY